MSLKELRLKRQRHEITAEEMAGALGISVSWFRQIEKYYHGPCIPAWRERYETALRELVEEKKARCN